MQSFDVNRDVVCQLPPEAVSELGNTGDKRPSHRHSRERSELEAAFGKKLDPTAGSPAAGKSVASIINLFVGDFFLEQVETKWNNAS